MATAFSWTALILGSLYWNGAQVERSMTALDIHETRSGDLDGAGFEHWKEVINAADVVFHSGICFHQAGPGQEIACYAHFTPANSSRKPARRDGSIYVDKQCRLPQHSLPPDSYPTLAKCEDELGRFLRRNLLAGYVR